jgi:spore photoproduct lyase
MIDTIYIEKAVARHPRTQGILRRFPGAARIDCDRFGEVFNPKAQNFRIQKARPALILAEKHGERVLSAPPGYGVGDDHHYYFSHMLNCLYDCRYCFLQGMYRSAHYVLFVNYEDFERDMDRLLERHPGRTVWFFSGYDCDSLALEPVSGFAEHFLQWFSKRPAACLELRTKSTQIRRLLNVPPLDNAVVAFSFTPDPVAQALEHRAPTVEKRLDAMVRLQEHGWRLGLRFDPLIHREDYRAQYRALFRQVFSHLDADRLHSVSVGSFRLPQPFFRNIEHLYPDEPLFAGPLSRGNRLVSYPPDLNDEMLSFCGEELLRYIPETIYYPCQDTAGNAFG